VARKGFLQVVANLPAVDLGDVARLVHDRNHQAPVEVFVPGGAQYPDRLQPLAHAAAGHALAVRDAQPQGAVGVAQVELVDRFGVVEPARL
jgi:hypothetical protein